MRPCRFILPCAAAFLVVGFGACATAPDPIDAVSGASLAAKGMRGVAGEVAPLDTGRRVLVAYFSQGTTARRVAEDFADLLGGDLERIVELRSRRGLVGFLGAGADSSRGLATPIEPPLRDPADYGLVVVCTPVWAGRLAPPVRTWLEAWRGRLPDCVFLEVSAATPPEGIAAMMAEAAGRLPLASEGFVQADFSPKGRGAYLGKIAGVLARLGAASGGD